MAAKPTGPHSPIDCSFVFIFRFLPLVFPMSFQSHEVDKMWVLVMKSQSLGAWNILISGPWKVTLVILALTS